MKNKLKEVLSKYDYVQHSNIEILGKKVSIPVVYPDASAVMIFIPASFDKLDELVKSDRIQPVRLIGNQSLLAITLFDYREFEIEPFREFTISVPVLVDSSFNPPLLPFMFDRLFKSFGFYVLRLGASSDNARKHIENIFPYPLHKPDIEVKIEEMKNNLYASLLEGGQEIMNISTRNPLPSSYKFKKKKYKTYYHKDEQLFNVTLDTFAFLTQSFRRKNISINFKSHELSDYINDICINSQPLGYIYYKHAIEIACFPKSI